MRPVNDPGPTVTLLRHGETEWSRSGRHTGRTDLDLTEVGRRQAGAAAALLDGPFDLVLCSPLRRARATAELAGLCAPEIDPDLREWDYGEMEGLTTAQIREQIPGWSIWDGPWPGGETADQVSARADRVVDRVRRQAAGSRVVLVAHGHLLRALAARWIREPVSFGRCLALDTASVSVLGSEHGAPALRRWNLVAGG